jgi:beta-N-acetylhexosaminidase
LRQLVGRKVIVGMRGPRPSEPLLRSIRKGKVGGVILFSENIRSARQVRSLSRALQSAAGERRLVIAVDQEGGIVKRLDGPPGRSAPEIGATGSTRVARHEGAATGRFLRGLGFNVNYAPVLDVPVSGSFMAPRAFGSSPGRVARFGSAFARGMRAGGVAPTAKHFPGLGRARTNTDFGREVIRAPRSALRRRDIEPFRAAVDAGVPSVMMSTSIYTAFGSRPAAFERSLVTGELRERLGFDGVIVTDTLEGAAVRTVARPREAAVAAARAGVDMVLFTTPEAGDAAYRGLLAAARDGTLDRSELEQSHSRIERLVGKMGG